MHVGFEDVNAGKASPSEAILFYGNMAVIASIREEKEQLVYGPPRQLQLSDLRRLLAEMDFGFVPCRFQQEHILAYDETRTVWYVRPSEQVLYFQTGDPALQDLSGQLFPQPALVFMAREGNLQVYALAEEGRPTPQKPLFVAPYYNTSQGTVCIGTTPLPHILHPDNTGEWVEAFFSSSFTHGTQNRIQNHAGSHAEMWKDVQQQGHFPAEYLLPTKLTLGDLMK